jgi:hypothetical protein
MDSELFGTWKITLEIQGFGIPAEHVPSAVASISLQRWMERYQGKKRKKKKIVK